jgi:hypothetical protein
MPTPAIVKYFFRDGILRLRLRSEKHGPMTQRSIHDDPEVEPHKPFSESVKPRQRAAIPPLEVFVAHCEACAHLVASGDYDFHETVDRLQADAVRTGLVDEIGQHTVRAIMASAEGQLDRVEVGRIMQSNAPLDRALLIHPAGSCATRADFHNPSDLTFEGFERSPLQHRPHKIRCRRRVRSGNAKTAAGSPRSEMTYRRMRNRSVQPPEDGSCSPYPSICYEAEHLPARADINNDLLSILVRARYFSVSPLCVTTELGTGTSRFGWRPALPASP